MFCTDPPPINHNKHLGNYQPVTLKAIAGSVSGAFSGTAFGRIHGKSPSIDDVSFGEIGTADNPVLTVEEVFQWAEHAGVEVKVSEHGMKQNDAGALIEYKLLLQMHEARGPRSKGATRRLLIPAGQYLGELFGDPVTMLDLALWIAFPAGAGIRNAGASVAIGVRHGQKVRSVFQQSKVGRALGRIRNPNHESALVNSVHELAVDIVSSALKDVVVHETMVRPGDRLGNINPESAWQVALNSVPGSIAGFVGKRVHGNAPIGLSHAFGLSRGIADVIIADSLEVREAREADLLRTMLFFSSGANPARQH